MDRAPLYDQIARGPEGGAAYWLKTQDDVRIRFGHWPSPPEPRGTVFLLCGRTEYIEKYGPAAADFAARGYAMLAIDWRGQGLADRLLPGAPEKGHVGGLQDYQWDLHAVIDAADELGLPKPYFLLGHSMGGAIGLRAIAHEHHRFSAAAFSAPMWGIKVSPLLHPLRIVLANLFGDSFLAEAYPPGMNATTYVYRDSFEDNRLTRDPEMWAWLIEQASKAPELTLAGPTIHWVAESLLECEALASLPSPDLPCYCGLGGAEKIVHTASVHDRMARWPKGELDVIPGAEHEIMMEIPQTRARFYDRCAALFDAAGALAARDTLKAESA
ncbi:alpha/beta hydrolase [Thioclava atlantica]|uniref:Lysophospholipase L2 n=1 Tax=Thioclava atlantica TaxID=1317124 RepID=A0A085U156_9RHOB|nr:alpha/beta hydrolase [Thioclava atlantica]KFE36703.1 lysophospholipase L2 [Thioclava atlantica]